MSTAFYTKKIRQKGALQSKVKESNHDHSCVRLSLAQDIKIEYLYFIGVIISKVIIQDLSRRS